MIFRRRCRGIFLLLFQRSIPFFFLNHDMHVESSSSRLSWPTPVRQIKIENDSELNLPVGEHNLTAITSGFVTTSFFNESYRLDLVPIVKQDMPKNGAPSCFSNEQGSGSDYQLFSPSREVVRYAPFQFRRCSFCGVAPAPTTIA